MSGDNNVRQSSIAAPFLLDDPTNGPNFCGLHEGALEHGCGCGARVERLARHLLHLIKMWTQAPVEEDDAGHAGAKLIARASGGVTKHRACERELAGGPDMRFLIQLSDKTSFGRLASGRNQ